LHFREEDAPFFFGRIAAIDRLANSFAKRHTQSENWEFVAQRPDESVRTTIFFPFGLVSAVPRTRIFHLNLRPK
jgi:hypothetical protein